MGLAGFYFDEYWYFHFWLPALPQIEGNVRERVMSSSNDVAIRVSNLSKLFKIYQKPADMFWELFTGKPRFKAFWALQNISFEVKRGQVAGIIGRNGAGKSTLLKIISGTLDKTAGEVQVRGKISALLELGSGFNPDYTGRENIYMGGIVLGMSREEIERKADAIIDFAELGDYIDQPFKTYSTGMQARLTFSVAISVEPDIFIVDEALAVGDVLFQEKCFRRMREIVASGATVLFVSHALNTVYELCDEAILLSKGVLLLRDTPRNVGYAYEQLLAEDRYEQQKSSQGGYKPTTTIKMTQPPTPKQSSGIAEATLQPSETSPIVAEVTLVTEIPIEPNLLPTSKSGSTPAIVPMAESSLEKPQSSGKPVDTESVLHTKAVIKDVQILNEQEIQVTTLYAGESYIIRVEAQCLDDIDNLSVGIHINLPTGLTVYGKGSWLDVKIPCKSGETIWVNFWLPNITLASGNYIVNAVAVEAVSSNDYTIWHYLRDATPIQVIGNDKFMGIADLKAQVKNVERCTQTVG